MAENNNSEDRRITPRSNVILPGRFRRIIANLKKNREPSNWLNSHISNVSEDGFCLAMPEGLEPDQLIEFEYYYHGMTFTGKAKVAWMDNGKSMAGCYVMEYAGKEEANTDEEAKENTKQEPK